MIKPIYKIKPSKPYRISPISSDSTLNRVAKNTPLPPSRSLAGRVNAAFSYLGEWITTISFQSITLPSIFLDPSMNTHPLKKLHRSIILKVLQSDAVKEHLLS
jgi:hypothetical protein